MRQDIFVLIDKNLERVFKNKYRTKIVLSWYEVTEVSHQLCSKDFLEFKYKFMNFV